MPSDSRTTSHQPALWIDAKARPDMELPPLPRTVAEVSRLVSEMKDEPDARKLSKIVNGDPVISAVVLRRINSAYYGMRKRISTVPKAVMLLGFLDVANVVLTAGMLRLEEVFSTDEHETLFKHVMRVSIGAAQYAKELADFLALSIQGEAYTAGLLHTVGRLIFLYNAPDDYAALCHADDGTHLSSIEAENFIFGINHAEVGGQAAEEWQLPESIVRSIRHYPDPSHLNDRAPRLLAALLNVAVAAINYDGSKPDAHSDLERSSQLKLLARMTEQSSQDLIAAIDKKQEHVQRYVTMMMS